MKLLDVTSVEEAIAIQNELKSKISLECQKPIACKYAAGVDLAYWNRGDTEYVMPDNEKGRFTDIVVDGEVYGRVLRTHKDVKPVFISAGNYIDLDTAAEIVCDFIGDEGHIPQPTRLADIETHRVRKSEEQKLDL